MAKYVSLVNGELAEVSGTQTSTGAGDAGKIPQLDASGRLDSTMLPVGVGADTRVITTSEILAAGDLVNIHSATGTKVRKADASNGREAHGFVIAGFGSAAAATVYFEGTISGLTGLTEGAKVYLGTTGQITATPPTTAGHISQRVGVALSATEVSFEPQRTITLA